MIEFRPKSIRYGFPDTSKTARGDFAFVQPGRSAQTRVEHRISRVIGRRPD